MGWFSRKTGGVATTEDMEKRLEFLEKLKTLTNKIHATGNLEQIMLELPKDICDLFHCDRMTLYAVSKKEDFIYSKIKTAAGEDKDLLLPVDSNSIAGWVALSGRTVRIHDVYDKAELKVYAADLRFSREVDQLTGYRTKQMLASPIFKSGTADLLGVIQLLNNRSDDSFTKSAEEGLAELCETLAVAFAQRMKAPAATTTKYDALVVNGVIQQPELDLAIRSAQRQGLDLEDVLIDEFKIRVSSVGQALASTFKLPYEGYVETRNVPAQILSKINRKIVDVNRSVPVQQDGGNVVILTIDPDLAIRMGEIKQLFPYSSLFYRITTKREFRQTVDQIFAAAK